jgi:CBS domain-containing protein
MPHVVRDQDLTTLPSTATVQTAVRRMVDKGISAVVVTADGSVDSDIVGIFTERDLTKRVVALGRDPRRVRLGEVMTSEPDTLPPEARPVEALGFMQKRNYRHLPVVQDGRLVGMVSIRDLFAVVKAELEEDVHECEAFVFGSAYSLDTSAVHLV